MFVRGAGLEWAGIFSAVNGMSFFQKKDFYAAALAVTSFFGMANARADSSPAAAPRDADVETITDMSGLRESAPGFLTHLRPDFLFYERAWNNYLKRRGSDADFDKLIEDCRNNPEGCHPRFRAFVELIDAVNLLPSDARYMRAELVSTGIDLMMKNNQRKNSAFSVLFHSSGWLQTPDETAVAGSGVCGDAAVWKYEAMKRAGFKPDNLRLIGGRFGVAYHTVLEANIDGRNLILEWSGFADRKDGDISMAGLLVSDTAYANGNKIVMPGGGGFHLNKFTPLVSFNDKGVRVYRGQLNRSKEDYHLPDDHFFALDGNVVSAITDRFVRIRDLIGRADQPLRPVVMTSAAPDVSQP